jgi:hypothetical protein
MNGAISPLTHVFKACAATAVPFTFTHVVFRIFKSMYHSQLLFHPTLLTNADEGAA